MVTRQLKILPIVIKKCYLLKSKQENTKTMSYWKSFKKIEIQLPVLYKHAKFFFEICNSKRDAGMRF